MAAPPWIVRHGVAIIGALGLPRATVEQVVADVGQFHRNSALAVLLRLNLAPTHHSPISQEEIPQNWLPDVAYRFLAVMREQKVEVGLLPGPGPEPHQAPARAHLPRCSV